jgi:hypothetical protein
MKQSENETSQTDFSHSFGVLKLTFVETHTALKLVFEINMVKATFGLKPFKNTLACTNLKFQMFEIC